MYIYNQYILCVFFIYICPFVIIKLCDEEKYENAYTMYMYTLRAINKHVPYRYTIYFYKMYKTSYPIFTVFVIYIYIYIYDYV